MTTDTIKAMKQALEALLDHYCALVNSGDAGNWNPETEGVVINARAAIEAAESAKKLAEGFNPLAESCKQTKFRRDIKTAVDRFLGWKLPKDFYPDCHVSFDREKASANNGWPIGTNLLTADQAKAMFEYCLEGTGYVAYPEADAKDAARLDWLESNPRHAQILVDGKVTDCVFYGISCASLMKLREAIDAAMEKLK